MLPRKCESQVENSGGTRDYVPSKILSFIQMDFVHIWENQPQSMILRAACSRE